MRVLLAILRGWCKRRSVMGIVNVTPDSFSDGGLFLDADAAVAHGRGWPRRGRTSSTWAASPPAPAPTPVPEEEELRRVVPVVEGLAAPGTRLDRHHQGGRRPGGARAPAPRSSTTCPRSGSIPRWPDVVAERGRRLLPHAHARRAAHDAGRSRATRTWSRDVRAFLEERLAFAVGEGVPEERVWLDPGIGFGKTVEHNLELLRRLDEIVAIGRPVVIGTSRKSFLGKLAGGRRRSERLAGHDRHERARPRARGERLPRARRRPERGCPACGRCYVQPGCGSGSLTTTSTSSTRTSSPATRIPAPPPSR